MSSFADDLSRDDLTQKVTELYVELAAMKARRVVALRTQNSERDRRIEEAEMAEKEHQLRFLEYRLRERIYYKPERDTPGKRRPSPVKQQKAEGAA